MNHGDRQRRSCVEDVLRALDVCGDKLRLMVVRGVWSVERSSVQHAVAATHGHVYRTRIGDIGSEVHACARGDV